MLIRYRLPIPQSYDVELYRELDFELVRLTPGQCNLEAIAGD